jgi:ATP-dependent Lon protease
MRDFRDAKAMAQTLREALNLKSLSLTRSESQEVIAKILGFRDWNVLAAKIQASQPTAAKFGTSAPAIVLPSISAGESVPVISMRDLVLFPHMTLSIFVGRDDTRRGVEFAMVGDRRVLVVAQRRDVDNDPNTLESLHPVVSRRA